MKQLGYLNLINYNRYASNKLRKLMVLPLHSENKIERGLRIMKRYAHGKYINMNSLFDYYK